MSKLYDGFRIIGPNSVDGALQCWYAPTLNDANRLAQAFCETTGREYVIAKYVGTWRRKATPAEFVKGSTK